MMKRHLFSLTLSLLLLLASVLNVHGLSSRIHDDAGLLSYDDIAALESLAEEVSSSTGMELLILTVESLGGQSPSAYADDYYDSNAYSDDGMLFMLALQERDWYISTSGKAIALFSDRDIDMLLDAALPYFSAGHYFEGFLEVLNEVNSLAHIETARGKMGATDLSNRKQTTHSTQTLLISVLIGGAVSGIVILIMRSTMNTKRSQRSATDYLTPGSYHLRTRQDIFLYSNVTKTPRQQSSSSGGTAHTSASGRSHGGGGRKF